MKPYTRHARSDSIAQDHSSLSRRQPVVRCHPFCIGLLLFSQQICRKAEASLQEKVRFSASTRRMLIVSAIAHRLLHVCEGHTPLYGCDTMARFCPAKRTVQ